ncbi:deoxyribodipyrimidine photolyase [Candidatus Marinamargulisbacteria bacterium SCGC AG-439-L15]|nr:deoxyribodipyrimidine photolyase [Candidatus Marinamargulisbacteria bacterium SCGC AG-439-L15]
MGITRGLVWIRRDLRLDDHIALSESLAQCEETHVFFNFDPHFLTKLPKNDRRITWLIESLKSLDEQLSQHHSQLIISYGEPKKELIKWVAKLNCTHVFFNRDYTPYADKRDRSVKDALEKIGIVVQSYKDHVLFEPDSISKEDGDPYTVFTPYKKKWLRHFQEHEADCNRVIVQLEKLSKSKLKTGLDVTRLYDELGFERASLPFEPSQKAAKAKLAQFQKQKLKDYANSRDFPSSDGTSGLSSYIRYGLISIRDCFRVGLSSDSKGAEVWVSELIWREFYQMILWRFPHVVKGSFKPAYDNIEWRGNPDHFTAWCQGETGFPIVDAAMRAFNQTGLMHNRLRMIVASFLCKTLLLDWRLGESYFADKLLDFELASNNGGWQWASSSGCDAQPYFRIFNPHTQAKKFDPNLTFIQTYCPEVMRYSEKEGVSIQEGLSYPDPIVNYRESRLLAMDMYKEGLSRTT